MHHKGPRVRTGQSGRAGPFQFYVRAQEAMLKLPILDRSRASPLIELVRIEQMALGKLGKHGFKPTSLVSGRPFFATGGGPGKRTYAEGAIEYASTIVQASPSRPSRAERELLTSAQTVLIAPKLWQALNRSPRVQLDVASALVQLASFFPNPASPHLPETLAELMSKQGRKGGRAVKVDADIQSIISFSYERMTKSGITVSFPRLQQWLREQFGSENDELPRRLGLDEVDAIYVADEGGQRSLVLIYKNAKSKEIAFSSLERYFRRAKLKPSN